MLKQSAINMIESFETLIQDFDGSNKVEFDMESLNHFDQLWSMYSDQFHVWKSHDAAGLEAELIRAAVELERSRLDKLASVTDNVRYISDIEALSAGVYADLELIGERIKTLTGDKGLARLHAAIESMRAQGSSRNDRSNSLRSPSRSPMKKMSRVERSEDHNGEVHQKGHGAKVDGPSGGQFDNLSLIWALLYDPNWTLTTKIFEEQWRDALGLTDPETANFDDPSAEEIEMLTARRKEQQKWNNMKKALDSTDKDCEKKLDIVSDFLIDIIDMIKSSAPQRVANECSEKVRSKEHLKESIRPVKQYNGSVTWINIKSFIEYITWSTNTLLYLCAPSRDSEILLAQKRVSDEITRMMATGDFPSIPSDIIVRSLRMILLQCKILRMDLANAHLQALSSNFSGMDLAVRIAYARTKLGHELNLRHPTEGPEDYIENDVIDKLPKTRGWLAMASSHIPRIKANANWNSEAVILDSQKPIDQTVDPSSINQVIPAMKTGVNIHSRWSENAESSDTNLKRSPTAQMPVDLVSWKGLVRVGLVYLISGDSAMALSDPETLSRDIPRLHRLKNEFQKIFVLAICLKIISSSMSEKKRSQKTDASSLRAQAKRRIHAILVDSDVSLNSIALEVASWVSQVSETKIESEEALQADIQSLLQSLLHRSSLQGRHVSEQIITALLRYVVLRCDEIWAAPSAVQQCGNVPHLEQSIEDVSEDIRALAKDLLCITAVTEAVCGCWYQALCKEFLH